MARRVKIPKNHYTELAVVISQWPSHWPAGPWAYQVMDHGTLIAMDTGFHSQDMARQAGLQAAHQLLPSPRDIAKPP